MRLTRSIAEKYRFSVSIHAPWEGCDSVTLRSKSSPLSFNSRTLGRVRHRITKLHEVFDPVSIHAPWEGCDLRKPEVTLIGSPFQFTHPGKGATSVPSLLLSLELVSIHAPWEGCDREAGLDRIYDDVSIHAPWEGCDE